MQELVARTLYFHCVVARFVNYTPIGMRSPAVNVIVSAGCITRLSVTYVYAMSRWGPEGWPSGRLTVEALARVLKTPDRVLNRLN